MKAVATEEYMPWLHSVSGRSECLYFELRVAVICIKQVTRCSDKSDPVRSSICSTLSQNRRRTGHCQKIWSMVLTDDSHLQHQSGNPILSGKNFISHLLKFTGNGGFKMPWPKLFASVEVNARSNSASHHDINE